MRDSAGPTDMVFGHVDTVSWQSNLGSLICHIRATGKTSTPDDFEPIRAEMTFGSYESAQASSRRTGMMLEGDSITSDVVAR